jgi:hypothetical protein
VPGAAVLAGTAWFGAADVQAAVTAQAAAIALAAAYIRH